MKRLTFLLFVLAGIVSVSAQTLLLKNGETVPANGLVRNGDMLMVAVKTSTGSTGQVGYRVADVAELNLPVPDVLKFAVEEPRAAMLMMPRDWIIRSTMPSATCGRGRPRAASPTRSATGQAGW